MKCCRNQTASQKDMKNKEMIRNFIKKENKSNNKNKENFFFL